MRYTLIYYMCQDCKLQGSIIFKHCAQMNTSRYATDTQSRYSYQREGEEQYDRDVEGERLLALEGQRKIIDYYFLELSLAKVVLLCLPLILSLIGLYFLFKSTTLRAKILYSYYRTYIPNVTTDILVIVNDSTAEIASIRRKTYQQKEYSVFRSQLLEYVIKNDKVYPLASDEHDKLRQCLNAQSILNCSLSTSDFIDKLTFFGGNQHQVEIPNYFSYLFKTLTEPLFMLQYLMFWVWLVQKLYWTTIGNFSFCAAVVSINYGILCYNYSKIRKIAEKQYRVKAIRNGQFIQISNIDIVPGDVLEVEKQIPCDCVLVRGNVLVNEANFTGENLPIIKNRIEHLSQFDNSSHWLYEGSELLQARPGTMAVAIYTGYTTHRGRIIRKIVKQNVKEPAFTHKILIFFVLAYLSAVFIYLAYLSKLMSIPIEEPVIIFLLFEIISLAVPIGYIGVVNFFPGLSLIKLDMKGIYGQEPYKVYESAQIKTICFDKTGTLTSSSVELIDIYACQETSCERATEILREHGRIRELFACCHMVKQNAEGELIGDQIDLEMFKKSQSILLETQIPETLWSIEIDNQLFDVLRVNQFESRHKSMSVLVRKRENNNLMVLIKGSPELIYRNSAKKCEQIPYWIKKLSMDGCRVIGLGAKNVKEEDLALYLRTSREMFLADIEMLGLVSFGNALREETTKVIQRLREEVNLNLKMITGDNIYTAVRTAFMAGIISNQQTVVVCEGHPSALIATSITFHGGRNFEDKEQIINNLEQYIVTAPSYVVFAIEDSFLEDSIFSQDTIDKIKVFARVTPENKTYIVTQLMKNIEQEQCQRSSFDNFLGSVKRNVCMVGDGANDLMAIKEADVGIGLADSDSTSSADFVVKRLDHIETIIREGKSISSIVVQSLVILFINTWLYIPLTLLAMANLCTISDATMLYKNIAFTIPLPIVLGLCQPANFNTSSTPQVNILAPKHQIIIWVNNFIFTLAFIYCFEIYWNSSEYQVITRGWVSMRNGFTTQSKPSTICFMLTAVHCQVINFVIYQKEPYKRAMSDNLAMTAWMTLNFLSLYIVYFKPEWLAFMGIQTISTRLATRLLIVMTGALGVSWAVTSLIYRYGETAKSEEKLIKAEIK